MVALSAEAPAPRSYYDYRAADGQLAYQVIRVPLPGGGKKFTQRRPDGRDGWIYSLGDLAPLPYLLPELLPAIATGWTIFIVEGEKCATILNAALAAAGVNAIATCNNGGAGKWGAAQSTYLAGASVVLLPDNDTAGRNHVITAGRALRAAGVTSLKMIPLPELAEKGDIADWLGQGNTIPDLFALVATADEYTPPAPEQATINRLPDQNAQPIPNLAALDRRERARLIGWARAALERATADLAGLNDGRFAGLKRTADRLGTIAAHGLLSDSECLNALYGAVASGYIQKKGTAAAEKEARWYFEKGKQYPCDLPDLSEDVSGSQLTAPITLTNWHPTSAQQWPADIPAVIDAIWGEFKLAKSSIILLRAVLKAVATGDLDPAGMTVNQITDATRLTSRQARNGLDTDSGVVFTDFAHSILDPESLDDKHSISKAKSGETLGSGKNGGRPSKVLILNPVGVIHQNILERIVIPRLKMRYFPSSNADRYAEPDAELLRAAGLDESLLDVLRQHLIYPAGNVDALKLFERDLNRWRIALNNFAPLELPALPDGMIINNSKRYNAAKIAAAALPYCDSKISLQSIANWTGVSRRTVSNLLPFAGVGMHDNYVYTPLVGELPEPTYNLDIGGMPTLLRYVDGTGEIRQLPYRRAGQNGG